MLETIAWTGSACRLLDQTQLPGIAYIDITDEKEMHAAIKRLSVRGAPAIGLAAAFGAYLALRDANDGNVHEVLEGACQYLATSRPTAVNLFWALDRIRKIAKPEMSADDIREALLKECLHMVDEDAAVCRKIGENALALLPEHTDRPTELLTHCNAGALATAAYGTALAPMYVGHQQGRKFQVWSDETRPLLQGSRITASELQAAGIPVTVICDNMAASVMAKGQLDAVIVGTDRVAANGDVANKIGTLGVAILAKHYGVPFYVASPMSTIDFTLDDGSQIPIEQRDPAEITAGMGKVTAPENVDVFNPAFDVTPNQLVTAIITEKGVAKAPYKQSLAALRDS